MIFEYAAHFADGHVALVSDVTPALARDRARRTYPDAPLVRMVDGWGSVQWDCDRNPYAFQRGWTSREVLAHAVAAPGRALCGAALKHVSRSLFEPDEAGVCRTCRREVLR